MSFSLAPRLLHPMLLWSEVALTTQEMLLSAGAVIQARSGRMALAGLAPNTDDLAELRLMSEEKMAAASESSAAIVAGLQSAGGALAQRTVRDWLSGATAWIGLATSLTPAQAAAHSHALLDASQRALADAAQVGSVGARIAQRGLAPVHARATANARRLARPAA